MKEKYIQILMLVFFALGGIVLAESESTRVCREHYSDLTEHADLVLIGQAASTCTTGVHTVFSDPHHSVTCDQVRTTLCGGEKGPSTQSPSNGRWPSSACRITWAESCVWGWTDRGHSFHHHEMNLN